MILTFIVWNRCRQDNLLWRRKPRDNIQLYVGAKDDQICACLIKTMHEGESISDWLAATWYVYRRPRITVSEMIRFGGDDSGCIFVFPEVDSTSAALSRREDVLTPTTRCHISQVPYENKSKGIIQWKMYIFK